MKKILLVLILIVSTISVYAFFKEGVLNIKAVSLPEKEISLPIESLAVVEEKPVIEEAAEEPAKEAVEEPAAESLAVVEEKPVVEEAVAEPAKEIVEELAAESVAVIENGPVLAAAAVEPAKEIVEELAAESVAVVEAEPVLEPAAESVAVVENGPVLAAAAVEPAKEIVEESAAESVAVVEAEPVLEPAAEPVAVVENAPLFAAAVAELAKEIVEELAAESVAVVEAEPVLEPAAESLAVVENEPLLAAAVAEQVKEIVEESAAESLAVFDDGREKIVVLPFDNFSKEINAIKKIMPGLKQRLMDRGLHVIDEDVLSDLLCDRRVRSVDYISKKIAREVGGELRAKTILAGSVVSFSSEGIPKVGILARLIDSSTGVILWADYASVSGDDYSIVFGMGTIKKIEDLVPKALDKLFASFSTDISKKNTESVYRIAVLPFENKSGSSNSDMIVTYMFLVEFLKDPGFEPIEYGEIRRLCVELRIRNKGGLEFKNIKALSDALGTYGILLGSVDDYTNGTRTSAVPKVGITARLLDARENRILWYNSLQLSGEDDIVVFDWGSVRQVDKLAYKAVSELVEQMGKSKWY